MERRVIDRLPFVHFWLTLGIFALLLLAYLTLGALLGGEGAPLGSARDAGQRRETIRGALVCAPRLLPCEW